MTGSVLYHGIVRHIRHAPMRHRFAYRVFSCLFDLDELPALDRGLKLFGFNRFAYFSFHDSDHGLRDGSPLRPWIEALVRRAGFDGDIGRIKVLCFPRILGFVFNPLSIYWVFDRTGEIRTIIYEVKNTFGDQHCYVHPVSANAGTPILHERTKSFHVSPFIDMECLYRFRVQVPGDSLSILIREYDGSGGELLTATLIGRSEPLSDRALLKALLRYPLMTLKVVAAIHFEAARLWLKGAKYRPRPAPPADEASL